MYDKQNLTKDVITMIWIASLMITGLVLISKFLGYDNEKRSKR